MKQRKLLMLVLAIFLGAGIADICILHILVIPELLDPSGEGSSSGVQSVPPTKEGIHRTASETQPATEQSTTLKIPSDDAEEGETGNKVDVGEVASPVRSPSSSSQTEAPATAPRPSEDISPESPTTAVEEARVVDAQRLDEQKPKATEKALPGIEMLRFGPNKTLLWKFEKKILRGVAKIVGRYSNVGVLLVGHADKGEKDPMALSQARADAAREYLIVEGVDGSKIETGAEGDRKPAAKGTSEQERKMNRRVRVRLILKDEM